MLMKRLSGKMLREKKSDRDAIASCPDEVLCRQTGRITYNYFIPETPAIYNYLQTLTNICTCLISNNNELVCLRFSLSVHPDMKIRIIFYWCLYSRQGSYVFRLWEGFW
jgi:hypothetical protein